MHTQSEITDKSLKRQTTAQTTEKEKSKFHFVKKIIKTYHLQKVSGKATSQNNSVAPSLSCLFVHLLVLKITSVSFISRK